jgi:orotate phosphoribosyltransferase
MIMTKSDILAAFESTGSILSGHFLLTSGRHSASYMQCAKVFAQPQHSEQLCAALCEYLRHYDAQCIISPAIGGIIMGYEVARCLGISNLFAERVDGSMQLRRGFSIEQGMRIIVVEDVVTTGGSVREVISMAQSMGGMVMAVASIVDRSGGRADFALPYHALLTLDIPSYAPADCPVCKAGTLPLYKPGSRIVAQ